MLLNNLYDPGKKIRIYILNFTVPCGIFDAERSQIMLTVTEAAEAKGCAGSTVRKALLANRINGSKHGRVWIVYQDSKLQAWTPREAAGRPPKSE